jgi:ABC-2 type transport system permease protein
VVKKVINLWALYARIDIMWLLKDFKNFFMCTVTDMVINLASITGVWLIAERFAGIGGLGKYQIIFMLGYSLAVGGVMNMMFNMNILYISRRIGRGQLDHLLIQPQPVWMSLLTEGFVPFSGSGVLLSGAGVLAYSLHKLEWTVSPLWLALLFICILLSSLVSLSYSFLWGSMAFYAPVAAEEVCTSISDLFSTLRNFPLGGLGKLWQTIMVSVLPVGLCAWYPSIALNHAEASAGVFVLAVLAAVYFALALIVFKRGMKHYVTKGSYRYHDRGHRR